MAGGFSTQNLVSSGCLVGFSLSSAPQVCSLLLRSSHGSLHMQTSTPRVCGICTSDQSHLQNTQEDTQEVTGTKENYFMQKKKKKKTIFISYCSDTRETISGCCIVRFLSGYYSLKKKLSVFTH